MNLVNRLASLQDMNIKPVTLFFIAERYFYLEKLSILCMANNVLLEANVLYTNFPLSNV